MAYLERGGILVRIDVRDVGTRGGGGRGPGGGTGFGGIPASDIILTNSFMHMSAFPQLSNDRR